MALHVALGYASRRAVRRGPPSGPPLLFISMEMLEGELEEIASRGYARQRR